MRMSGTARFPGPFRPESAQSVILRFKTIVFLFQLSDFGIQIGHAFRIAFERGDATTQGYAAAEPLGFGMQRLQTGDFGAQLPLAVLQGIIAGLHRIGVGLDPA